MSMFGAISNAVTAMCNVVETAADTANSAVNAVNHLAKAAEKQAENYHLSVEIEVKKNRATLEAELDALILEISNGKKAKAESITFKDIPLDTVAS